MKAPSINMKSEKTMTAVKSNWNSSIKNGEYKRKDSQFRNQITADGSSGFKAEADRYHLYVSLACPWAHRTLIFRTLKGLEDLITVSVVHPDMHQKGWSFSHDEESAALYGTTGDTLYNSDHMLARYIQSAPDYAGNITVPVLWDKKQQIIVNNESAEIIRMLNTEFNHLTGNQADFYPEALQTDIDIVNELVYHNINNGVYKTGFATTQQSYQEHGEKLFTALDQVEAILANKRYLTGDKITEADWRLWTTLIRFDSVYHTHFKCNLRTLQSYTNIYNYMLELYQILGIAETVNEAHIKRHYYASHLSINPFGIIPMGHEQDWNVSHNRGSL